MCTYERTYIRTRCKYVRSYILASTYMCMAGLAWYVYVRMVVTKNLTFRNCFIVARTYNYDYAANDCFYEFLQIATICTYVLQPKCTYVHIFSDRITSLLRILARLG